LNIESRAELEVSVFLMVWFICLIYSFIRPSLKAWSETLLLTALALLLLPLIDFLIEPHWLMQAIEYRNMAYIGFDLALIVCGAVCLSVYKWLKRVSTKNKEIKSEIKNKVGALC